jgi:hypothetical protein
MAKHTGLMSQAMLTPPSPLRIDDPSRTRLGGMHLSQDLTPASGRQDHTTSPSATISRPRSCRTSCRPASSGKDGLQRRSSARRPIAHGKTRPAIPLRARRCRVHRIPPRVRDVSRSAPHPGGTRRACKGDLPDALSGIFSSVGLDRILLICPSGCFPSSFCEAAKVLCRLAMLPLQFSRSPLLGTNRTWRCGRRRSVVGGKAENIYSG